MIRNKDALAIYEEYARVTKTPVIFNLQTLPGLMASRNAIEPASNGENVHQAKIPEGAPNSTRVLKRRLRASDVEKAGPAGPAGPAANNPNEISELVSGLPARLPARLVLDELRDGPEDGPDNLLETNDKLPASPAGPAGPAKKCDSRAGNEKQIGVDDPADARLARSATEIGATSEPASPPPAASATQSSPAAAECDKADPPAFAAGPEKPHPSETGEAKKSTPGAELKVAVGDEVQWTSLGQDQFTTPRKVTRLLDGNHVQVEGSNTGIPIGDLTIVRRAAKASLRAARPRLLGELGERERQHAKRPRCLSRGPAGGPIGIFAALAIR